MVFYHFPKIVYKSRSDVFDIHFIGDIHLGSASCDEDSLKKVISDIKSNPFARVIIMGDVCDYITQSDKRFRAGELADWIGVKQLDNLLNIQLDYAIELFRPIAPQILGAHLGNHETNQAAKKEVSLHDMFCNALQVKDLGYSSLTSLRFQRRETGGERTTLTIYAHHGHGGG
jgi:hypothetical protein